MTRAFTLVETMFVVALSAGIMIVLASLFYNFNNISTYEQAAAQSSNSASEVVGEFESLAEPADAVLASRSFSGVPYTSTTTSVILEIPSIDASGNSITNTYDYAVLYMTGTSIYRILDANALSHRSSGTKRLSAAVSAFTLSYDSSDFPTIRTITIDVQTQAAIKQNIISDHRHEQIRLRNHQ